MLRRVLLFWPSRYVTLAAEALKHYVWRGKNVMQVTVVADELQQFRVDAQTAYEITMHQVQVAVGVSAPLQYL